MSTIDKIKIKNVIYDISADYSNIANTPTFKTINSETILGSGNINTGTYSKPNDGIPKGDLATSVQTSLNKADTALQTEQYTGTITGITMNGASKGTSGVVDLGTVITSHQDISGKQDKIDSSHKLSSDLIDDTNKTNKFVTSAEKTKIDNLPNIVILTQTEYDAITIKSETTIYMIVED